MTVSDDTPGPSSSSSRAGVPHSRGERSPGGGGEYRPTIVNRLPTKLVGCPVGEADAAARAAHPQQLGGCDVRLRREHHAECRQHDVERRVGEREDLGVGRTELDGEALGVGAGACAVEELGDVVRRGDHGAASGGGQGGVAIASGDVDDEFAGSDIDGLTEQLAGELQRCADRRVVAGRPGVVLAGFDGGDIEGGRGGGHWGSCG